jgi:hypothetical protein
MEYISFANAALDIPTSSLRDMGDSLPQPAKGCFAAAM